MPMLIEIGMPIKIIKVRYKSKYLFILFQTLWKVF